MPKKKLEKKLQEGEEVPTQDAAKEIRQSFENKGGYVAYADFMADGVQYKAGDVFEMPKGWQLDEKFQELLHTKSKPRGGVVFYHDDKRVTLPVEEA